MFAGSPSDRWFEFRKWTSIAQQSMAIHFIPTSNLDGVYSTKDRQKTSEMGRVRACDDLAIPTSMEYAYR